MATPSRDETELVLDRLVRRVIVLLLLLRLRLVHAAVLVLERQPTHLDVHVALNDGYDPGVCQRVLSANKAMYKVQNDVHVLNAFRAIIYFTFSE